MRLSVHNGMTPLETALALHDAGLWPHVVLPRNKNPIPIAGRGWLDRATPGLVRELFAKYPDAGVGLMLGREAGLVDFDGDGAASPALIERLFPGGPPPTLSWQSRHGIHYTFAWDDQLARFGDHVNIWDTEVRVGADNICRVVTAPTLGMDGLPRRWIATDLLPLPAGFADRFQREIEADWRITRAPLLRTCSFPVHRAWIFLSRDRRLPRFYAVPGHPRPEACPGETVSADPAWGMLAYSAPLRAIDSPDSPILARVEVWGEGSDDRGKLSVEHIKVLWTADATDVLVPVIRAHMDRRIARLEAAGIVVPEPIRVVAETRFRRVRGEADEVEEKDAVLAAREVEVHPAAWQAVFAASGTVERTAGVVLRREQDMGWAAEVDQNRELERLFRSLAPKEFLP